MSRVAAAEELGATSGSGLEKEVNGSVVMADVSKLIQKIHSGPRSKKFEAGLPVIQRNPKKNEDDDYYHDTQFPSVILERLASNLYRIVSEGTLQGTTIRFDDDYYEVDDDNEAVFERPVTLIDHIAGNQQALAEVSKLIIGQPGHGAVAGSSGEIVLETFGIMTCVGWLLYNDQAAYMEHIVVAGLESNPVDTGALASASTASKNAFVANAGSEPTNLLIQLNVGYYPNGAPEWINSLIPDGITSNIVMGGGGMIHTIGISHGDRLVWRASPIIVKPRESKSDGDGDAQASSSTTPTTGYHDEQGDYVFGNGLQNYHERWIREAFSDYTGNMSSLYKLSEMLMTDFEDVDHSMQAIYRHYLNAIQEALSEFDGGAYYASEIGDFLTD